MADETQSKMGGWRGSPNSLAALRPGDDGSRALKAGLHAKGFMRCKACADRCELYQSDGTCEVERLYHEDRMRQLSVQDGVDGDVDRAQIAKIAWLEIMQARALSYLAANGGGFRAGKGGAIEAQPILREWLSMARVHGAELDRLLASPAARARTKVGAEVLDAWADHRARVLRIGAGDDAAQEATHDATDSDTNGE